MRITTVNGFTGIDERADFKNNLSVAAAMNNFRVTDSGSLTKRQGVSWVLQADGEIEGIWTGKMLDEEFILYSAGGNLYRAPANISPAGSTYIGRIGFGKCMMFKFNNVLYIKNDDAYMTFDGRDIKRVDPYIPLVAFSCAPNGEGEIFEQINLLCDQRRQQFSGNASALLYVLAEKNIDCVDYITVDGETIDIQYSVDRINGTISFKSAPPAGINNIEVTYTKTNLDSDKRRILGCTKVMLFGGNSDGRLFLWGNPDYPNYRFHSELANGVPSAEYFPINAFTIIGSEKINCIVQQYDRQLIFSENEAFYSYCEMRDDGLGNTYSSFPVFSLNKGKGCLFETDGCVIENKPVTLCLDGLNMWESTSVQNEKNAVCFSGPIQNSLKEIIAGQTDKMKIFDFQANREMYFIYDTDAYIYNYGNGSWYHYDDFGGEHHAIFGKTLYFSRGQILCAFGNDMECDLERACLWESPYIDTANKYGRCDLIRFDADMHVIGNENIRFEFKKSGLTDPIMREINFPTDTDGYLRISLRPALKRAMPFNISFTDNGPGKCTLHGITIKTRDKERSRRDGLL